jgi:hypothetical protein
MRATVSSIRPSMTRFADMLQRLRPRPLLFGADFARSERSRKRSGFSSSLRKQGTITTACNAEQEMTTGTPSNRIFTEYGSPRSRGRRGVRTHSPAPNSYSFTFQTALDPDMAWRSRRMLRARFAIDVPLSEVRGRREDRVRAAPAVSRANCTNKNAHEHTGSAEAVRPSLRNGFTAYTRSPR